MATLAGRMLGRYRLESLLGQGGMAQVYKATDSKLGRVVAVKVILPAHASDAHFMERFLREARVVALLEHPNILPIYDFGEDDGSAFLVMPYLEGGTLRDRMLGQPIPLPQAVSWIRQLGDALDAAHDAGILHRDVKPANVLIGKGDRLALADFGIAKMLESLTGLTATGVVVGTPIYMAPEQAQGHPASSASDRYALAVLAYELLSGRPPFDGESALALMNQHVTMPPPALSTRIRGLPSGLDTIFIRALAKDPAERPVSCRALSDSLAEYLPTGSQMAVEVATASWAPAGSGPRSLPAVPPEERTAPTVLAGQSRPSSRVTLATPPPGLTSEVTLLQGRSLLGLRRFSIPALAAVLLVLGGVFAWRSSVPSRVVRTQPPATAAVLPKPPDVPKASDAVPPVDLAEKTAPTASLPPLVVVELPTTTVVAPSKPKSVEEIKPDGARLEQLASAVDDSIAKGKLAPPDVPNAIEAIAALRREFPASRRVPIAERRLADAFEREAERHVKAGEYSDAKSDLKSAQLLAPDDAEIAARLKQADAALAQAVARGSRSEPGEPSSAEPSDGPLSLAHHRLDPSRKQSHRPDQSDYQFALEEAQKVLLKFPNNGEALFLRTYAQGALNYLARDDSRATQALVEASSETRRTGSREGRMIALLLRRPDGSMGSPNAWELALAYGDARGEAEGMIDRILQKDPKNAKVLFGRAHLRRIQGRNQEAIADARRAFDASSSPALGAPMAGFLAEEYARAKDAANAMRWFRIAVKDSPPEFVSRIAFRASKVARENGNLGEAEELLRIACRSGNKEACAEVKTEPNDRRPLRRRFRK